jgi:hypothetical protein
MFEADIKPYPYDSTKYLLSNIRDIELLDTTTKYKRKRVTTKAE